MAVILFKALHLAICATAMRFTELDGSRVYEGGLEENLFNESYEVLQEFSFEWSSAEIIQGWLLLIQYTRMGYRHTASWSLLGNASRCKMKDVSRFASSEYDNMNRTRVFSCRYTWDETGSCYVFRGDDTW